MDDLLADFLTETNESLAELDVALVRLEQTPNDEATLAQIFRLVHTIKGTCGFLGLPRLEHVAHAAENVLGRVRDKLLPITPEMVSVVLAALDRIKLIVRGLEAHGAEPAGDDTGLIATLDATIEAGAAGAPAAAPPVVTPPAVELNVEPLPSPAPAMEPAVVEVAADAPAAGQTIRVGVDVLEGLMTLVSELVLTRNQLLQLARGQENSAFTVPLQRLSHITSDLQEGVMKTRMQPIGNAWNKLPRLVRDLSRELGKKIDLVMHGADTELDRQVLELIKDPLTHMVRNSADHGLEPPDLRRRAGKPETGRITLNAFHEGGHILIEIADDGAGLPVEKIRAKAVARGMAAEAEIAAMPDAQVLRFIFRPGFSTAAAVTAVSGRGVGMDVVKTNIEKIGGTVDLKSAPGQGTTFTIKIPLTLAIVSALIVEAGGERFAIPQISVVELVRARAARRDALADDVVDAMTTNESFFFRDDKPFTHFRAQSLPALLNARPASARLRIWSAASSSGQEAYSLAMILAECRAQTSGRTIEILGTDISREQLTRAREALYTQFEVQRGLPMQLLVKYFRKEGGNWRLVDPIRAMASFREWNLLNDLTPLGKFDIVFCRNVLIYFDQTTKARVLDAIARQLAPDGLLYLGGAETVLGLSSRFSPVPGERGVYTLAPAVSTAAPVLSPI